jgi:hypothetical protein
MNHDLSQQPKYNSLELKISRAVINTVESTYDLLQVKTIIIWPLRKIFTTVTTI